MTNTSLVNMRLLSRKVIIRTFSAGIWFGLLESKEGAEVILEDARRMWLWHAEKSISLSAVALYGIDWDKSKIAPAVPMVWLEAIEIIPCTDSAIISIEGAPDAVQPGEEDHPEYGSGKGHGDGAGNDWGDGDGYGSGCGSGDESGSGSSFDGSPESFYEDFEDG